MEFLAPVPVLARLALTLAGLGRAVAGRVGVGVMSTAMIVLVWQRVRRVEREIAGLMARFRAGRLRVLVAPRVRRVGLARSVVGSRLPRRFGWLLPLVPAEAAGYAGQVRAVLAEPEMVALLLAAPQARRVLRPLCRMLGIERGVLELGLPEAVVGGVAAAEWPRRRVPVRPAAGGEGAEGLGLGRRRSRRMRIGSFDVMLE